MHTHQTVHIVLSENVPPTWGGVARVAFNISVALAAAGRTTVLCGFDRYVSAALYRNQAFTVMPIASRGWKWAKDLTMWRLMRRLRRQYGDRPVVLYALTWKMARVSRYMCQRMGWRLVVFAHGLEVTKHLAGGTNRRMLRVFHAADLCLGVSRYTADVLCEIGVPKEKVRVLNNSVDTAEYFPVPATGHDFAHEMRQVQALREKLVEPGGVVILTLARVIERKGQDTVITALARLLERLPADHPPLRYVIAGKGPQAELERLRQLARRLGVVDRVLFWGYVPTEQMRLFYNACDIYVMNSRIVDARQDVEGFGITFLEASACAKPVIGGRSGGVADAVADGASGYLVDPQDIDALTAKLQALVADPALRKKMGENGLMRVQREFTIDAIGRQLLEIIDLL